MCVTKKTLDDHNQEPTYEEIIRCHKAIPMEENAAYGHIITYTNLKIISLLVALLWNVNFHNYYCGEKCHSRSLEWSCTTFKYQILYSWWQHVLFLSYIIANIMISDHWYPYPFGSLQLSNKKTSVAIDLEAMHRWLTILTSSDLATQILSNSLIIIMINFVVSMAAYTYNNNIIIVIPRIYSIQLLYSYHAFNTSV